MLVRFDVSSDKAITRILVDLEGDGEPGVQLSFDGQRDGRYIRALSFKPAVNGVWQLSVTAWDADGCSGKTTQPASVIVVSG